MALLNANQEHFYYGLSKCMKYFRGTTESVKSDNMPPRHQAYQRSKEYNVDYFIRQGKYIGEHTTHVLEVILDSKPFIQQSYKSCQGILSLSRKFSPD